MEEYNGWTLYDKVTLVLNSRETHNNKYRKAYVANSADKGQLATAIKWGRSRAAVKDKDGNYIVDKDGHTVYETLEPEIIETDNKDFKVTLLNSAGRSTQGGKLSFWNCLVEKGKDIKCVIGINSELLLTLMLNSTMTNGKCDKKLMFARQAGATGLLHEEMKEYKEALADMQKKADMNKGKTSKWQLGHSYKTLTSEDVYIGDIYKPIDIKANYDIGWAGKTLDIDITDNEVTKKHVIVPISELENCKSFSEYFRLLNSKLDKRIECAKAYKDKQKHVIKYDIENIVRLNPYTAKSYARNKFPSRKVGDFQLEVDVDVNEELSKLLNKAKQAVIEISKECGVGVHYFVAEELSIHTVGNELCALDIEILHMSLGTNSDSDTKITCNIHTDKLGNLGELLRKRR